MNKIWTVIALISVAVLSYTQPQNVLAVMNEASGSAVTLMIKLAGVYTVWMGLMAIAEKAGLTQKVAKLLKPVIKFLFGNVSEETQKHLSLNMSSNMLGIGAATPAGVKAVQSMDEGSEIATNAMIMLLVINSTSIQLLPTTIISLRQTFGSINPSGIIVPAILASLLSTAFAVFLVKILGSKTKDADKKIKAMENKKPLKVKHNLEYTYKPVESKKLRAAKSRNINIKTL